MYRNIFEELQFKPKDIRLFCEIRDMFLVEGKEITRKNLINCGLDYEKIELIKYMNDISIGKVNIDSREGFCKHLRKITGNVKRIGIQDLMVSSVREVPRKAVIAGISDDTFKIYNSKDLPLDKKQFDVVSVTSSNINIKTKIKPVLRYKQNKFIEGVIEIKEVLKDGSIILSVNKDYCRLCNRFIIVASLRLPEFHLGMYELVGYDGTMIYVYAQNLGVAESLKYYGGTQRVYDYGFYPNEIGEKLRGSADIIYNHLGCVRADKVGSTQDFIIVPEGKEKSA